MIGIFKKILMVLCIFVIASIMFSGTNDTYTSSSADEVVNIIDGNSSSLEDGYVEVPTNVTEKKNVFVIIIETISNLINAIFKAIFNIISNLISSFAG